MDYTHLLTKVSTLLYIFFGWLFLFLLFFVIAELRIGACLYEYACVCACVYAIVCSTEPSSIKCQLAFFLITKSYVKNERYFCDG